MTDKNRIIETLGKLQNFFEEHNEKGWTERTKTAIRQIQEGKTGNKSVLCDFIGAGMGGLIDLYICAENGQIMKRSETETNEQLANLQEEILTIKNALR
jgi:hypothetical protein